MTDVLLRDRGEDTRRGKGCAHAEMEAKMEERLEPPEGGRDESIFHNTLWGSTDLTHLDFRLLAPRAGRE